MVDSRVIELAHQANFAAFTTLLPSGRPMTHVMWVDCDDAHILINTEVHRRKFENVQRDPRVAVMIWDADNPYRYVEVRGPVVETVTGPEARAHIDKLSEKYTGKPFSGQAIRSERVILKIKPEHQRAYP